MYYKVSAKVIRYRVADVVEFLMQSNCCSYQKDRINELIRKCLVKL